MKTLIRVSIAVVAVIAVVALSSCTSTSSSHDGGYHHKKHGGITGHG